MRNSQFLHFVSKMSRGELIFEDNKVTKRFEDNKRQGMPALPNKELVVV